MPLYAPNSPSLRKTEAGYGSRHTIRSRKRFSVGRILGDPFALAAVAISILAWLIAFVSSVISDIQADYPNFIWWTVAYYFACIIGIIITIAADGVFKYHVAIVGYMAAGLILSTSAVNTMVYSSKGPEEAAAAGFILLSMVAIVWIFYFGSQPQASHRAYIDSFALHRGERQSPMSRSMSNPNFGQTNSYAPQAYANNNPLKGFETSSPIIDNNRGSQARFTGGPMQTTGMAQPNMGTYGDGEDETPAMTYPYQAKAIYNYERNKDDPNEISFQKGDILEVSDVSGKWWQAKNAKGDVGIAPSNYLILL